MQTVTNQIKQSMAGSSWIRKMFEKGLELKKRYGSATPTCRRPRRRRKSSRASP